MVQVDPIKPALKAPGTERWKLKYDEPPSKFAFKINLRRYSVAVGLRLDEKRTTECDGKYDGERLFRCKAGFG